jgi:hypothetical protein
MNRTEHDLRAALRLAADDHPRAADVVPSKPSRRLKLVLPLAAAAAVLVAVGVPVLLLNHDQTGRSTSGVAAGVSSPPTSTDPTSGVAHGPVNGPSSVSNPVTIPGSSFASAGHTCRPDEVSLSLVWSAPTKTLLGTLTVVNTSRTGCDLLTKPSIVALGADGKPVQSITTAEGRIGAQILAPGASTRSVVTWTSWCGGRTSGPIGVSWGTGEMTVTPTGQIPTASCATPSEGGSISAGWFDPLS